LQNTDCVSSDGFIDLTQTGSVASLGLDGYYNTAKLGRYSYARVGESSSKL
jgi:hypothetical protein